MSESSISREIVAFLRDLGCKVSVQSRRDPGGWRTPKNLPDLHVVHVGKRVWTWVELKRPKGTLREGQGEFRDLCLAVGIPWELWSSLDDARAWAKVHLGVE